MSVVSGCRRQQSSAGLVAQCPGDARKQSLGHLHKDFNQKSQEEKLPFEMAPRTSVSSASSPGGKIIGF